MIFDKISNAAKYKGISTGLDRALEYLQKEDFSKLQTGTYELDGDKMFAVCSEYETKDISEIRTEAHKKYIDVQYIVSGIEKMYTSEISGLKQLVEYDAYNDITFFENKPECEFTAKKGCFAVFFPWDAHIPCVNDGNKSVKVKKVVVKVHV